MTKNPHILPPAAGTALPLASHKAILPELTDQVRQYVTDDAPLKPSQLAAILAHSQHLQTLARAHPDLLATVPTGGGAAEIGTAIEVCERDAETLGNEQQINPTIKPILLPGGVPRSHAGATCGQPIVILPKAAGPQTRRQSHLAEGPAWRRALSRRLEPRCPSDRSAKRPVQPC